MTVGDRQMPPGWYPDPRRPRRQYRYWDGRTWTPHVQPPPPAAIEPRGRRLRLVGAAGVVLAVVLIYVAVVINDQEIKSVDIKTGSVSFYSTGDKPVDSTEIRSRQTDVEERVSNLETRAQESAGASRQLEVDISGVWSGSNGLTYQVQQFGSSVVIEEQCSCGGVTAVGDGTFDGTTATMSYQAYDGSVGRAELVLVDDSTLQGTFLNTTYGTEAAADLRR